MSYIANLPTPNPRRIAVKIKPTAEKHLRQGHPWLFEQSITKLSFDGKPGDVAVIFDKNDEFLAAGLYDPASEIRVKVLIHGDSKVFDARWIHKQIQKAYQIRIPLEKTTTTGYRLINGENDSFPNLVVDRYGDVLVMKLYSPIWLPYLNSVLDSLVKIVQPATIVLRFARRISEAEALGLQDGQVLHGDLSSSVVQFVENGLLFQADVVKGHKTGFFFDQRDNRAKVRALSRDRHVLDVFCYSGGFTVSAFAGGAKSVLSLDSSQAALDEIQENIKLNWNDASTLEEVFQSKKADAFSYLDQLLERNRQFDLVVIDPPSMANQQGQVDSALEQYRRLAMLGSQLTKRNGILVISSCSSRVKADIFFATISRSFNREPLKMETTEHALDHPVTFEEGRYLKCAFVFF